MPICIALSMVKKEHLERSKFSGPASADEIMSSLIIKSKTKFTP